MAFESILGVFGLTPRIDEARRPRKPRLGTGERFRRLERQLADEGVDEEVRDPAALAAWIGRRKYGKRRFQGLASAGRRRRSR